MSKEVRIAIVEDSAPYRKSLVNTLEARRGWRVVAQCASAPSALRDIPKIQPDLLLLDISLPNGHSGVDLIAPLRALLPTLEIIMLTVVEEPAELTRAIRAGACGYIVKREASNLVQIVDDVLNGGAPGMSPSVARHLWNAAERLELGITQKSSGLTPREWEVLRLTFRGRQIREIATELGITVNTVKTHIRSIYQKLGVSSPIEALIKLRGGRSLLDDTF